MEGLPGINMRSDSFGYGSGVGLHFCACSAGYLRNKLRKCCRVERIEECHSISILDRQGIQKDCIAPEKATYPAQDPDFACS